MRSFLFASALTLFVFLGLLRTSIAQGVLELGLTCSDHPAPTKPSVLVRSWNYLSRSSIVPRAVYYARFKRLEYIPVGDSTSNVYKGLDFFYAGGSGSGLRMYFQRPAKVYLFVNAFANKDTLQVQGSLPGWKPEGYASLIGPPDSLPIGVHQKNWISITQHAYVFSKKTTGRLNEIFLHQNGWLLNNIKRVKTKGLHHFRIAEADGSPSQNPGTFKGTVIEPNVRCPDVLHQAWSTTDNNKGDQDTIGMQFGTWHPQWDPCYWCAYDHDHGSAAPILMKYKPKYGYTTWKNGRRKENHEGFKDFVFKHDGHYVYISFHGQTSSMRRVTERHHTITIAIKRISNGELVAELTAKGDFGFLAGRTKQGALPLTQEARNIYHAQLAKSPPLHALRAINVVNVGSLDRRFRYNYPPIKGVYEVWKVDPICTTSKHSGRLTFDFQDAITAIKTATSTIPVWLGRQSDNGEFYHNTGLKRTMRASQMTINAQSCGFGDSFKGGYFYTDAFGKMMRSGPGRDAVRQFIKPGFQITIDGLYKPMGYWLGLHSQGISGSFEDFGYGINPKVN